MKGYWKVVALGVGCLLLSSAYFTSVALSYVGEVIIMNSARESIESGQVEVCGQRFELGDIGQGKTKVVQYKVKSDSHFEIIVEFVSGRKMSKKLGYVTSGRDFKHVLTVTDDGASIELQ